MEIKLFSSMFKDKHFCSLEKMKHKYGTDFNEFLQVISEMYYKPIPLSDFSGNDLCFIENHASVNQSTVKLLLKNQSNHYGVKAAEDEIVSTSAIENIDFSRDSVRNILKGYAPKDEQESRILGIKKGLEFIADTSNKITEENLHKLYMMTVGDFLEGENKLNEGEFYRHDTVYVVGNGIEHSGVDHKKVPVLMKALIEFANTDDGINDLVKAAIIHFYFAYVHPYFDGNGRTARLVHLWFLIQIGYQSALFIPFSGLIEKSRKAYYDAFTLIEENRKISQRIDVTPFVLYFIENVYNKMSASAQSALSVCSEAVKSGELTKKENELLQFVISCYGTDEFSTKQLEKDFGNAAYATIRSFVLKLEKLGLLTDVKYGTRTKYKIAE